MAYDPQLRGKEDLTSVPFELSPPRGEALIEEEFTSESNGGVKVRIADKVSDYANEYRARGSGRRTASRGAAQAQVMTFVIMRFLWSARPHLGHQ